MQKKIFIIWLLFLLGLGVSQVSLAVSLGDLKVYSYLNEPLSAEIILNGVDEIDPNNILVELASDKDFIRSGITKSFFLSRLKFEVLRNNDTTVIYISTSKAVKNSFLDFLIQVIWPDGKIVKSYAILLDPTSEEIVNREVPISQQKSVSKNGNKKIFSEALFATSLEDTIENEAYREMPVGNKKQLHIAAEEAIAATPAITNEPDPEDFNAYGVQTNNESNGVLDQVVSSLQVFSKQPKTSSVDYEKLLDLKPNVAALHKDSLPLAESLAMVRVNNELESLRNNISNNDKKLENKAQDNQENNKNNIEIDTIRKYGSDLLLACLLASTTVFMFFKVLNQNNNITVKMPISEQEKKVIKEEISSSYQNNNFIKEPTIINRAIDKSIDISPFIRHEELELKIDLARQYIEAGDKKSAKDILQDLNLLTIKESKYRDQIDSLLRCLV